MVNPDGQHVQVAEISQLITGDSTWQHRIGPKHLVLSLTAYYIC